MIQLSEGAQQSLEMIRKKIEIKAIDFNSNEFNALADVYFEITRFSTGKGMTLSKGCSGCIPSACQIVRNYIENFETKDPQPAATVEVKKITVQVDSLEDLTKAELKQQCRDKGIKIPHNANKTILIELLS